MEAGINQLGKKKWQKGLTVGGEVELGITHYSSVKAMIVYHMPSTNMLTM
jgi:positive regulator of sigma E activity